MNAAEKYRQLILVLSKFESQLRDIRSSIEFPDIDLPEEDKICKSLLKKIEESLDTKIKDIRLEYFAELKIHAQIKQMELQSLS